MLNSHKIFLLIVLLTGLFFSQAMKEGFNQFRGKLVHTDLTPFECQKRCADNGNCRYSNTPRAINNTQKKGACYHSFGNRGQ